MSAPEVLTHSDLEVAENGSKMSSWTNLKSPTSATTDYREVPQPYPTDSSQAEYTPEYSNFPEVASPQKKRGCCGLGCCAVLAIIAAMVVMLGIGLGAGVGAGMAVQRNKVTQDPSTAAATTVTVTATVASATSSATSVSYTPSTLVDAVLPTNGTVLLNCPSIDAEILRITLGSTVSRFAVACGTDTTATNQDIIALISYSLEDCAQACASYNRNYGQAKCVAATFQRNLTSSVGKDYGNCWLKNGTVGGVASTRNDYAGLRLQ